jgi:mono/diheme cytochrome c family protein
MLRGFFLLIVIVSLSACQNYNPMQDYDLKQPVTDHDVPVIPSQYAEADVMRGNYLAELLACGTCHTQGALVGEPDPGYPFAGSSIGIAYTNPFENENPGVLYPANITPDEETGIGSWSDEAVIDAIRMGIDSHGNRMVPVMPWLSYSKIKDEDARALTAFLRSLKPVQHQVPRNVRQGQTATSPYVHFGVYQSKR